MRVYETCQISEDNTDVALAEKSFLLLPTSQKAGFRVRYALLFEDNFNSMLKQIAEIENQNEIDREKHYFFAYLRSMFHL